MRRVVRACGFLLAGCLTAVVPACGRAGFSTQKSAAGLPSVIQVRDIRVLIADTTPQCRLRVAGPYALRSATGQILQHGNRLEWTLVRADPSAGIVFGDRALGSGVLELVPQAPNVVVELARGEGTKWESPQRYPGLIRLSLAGPNALRVVNELDLETYVACVLPGELFPQFAPEAFRAQAVAVRTYALYQMAQRGALPYDVNASQFSQVYHGLAGGEIAARAREAAEYSRGIVTTWGTSSGERIFCTFYSSCCGGRTQSVANCRPDMPLIPPLAGGVKCDCLSVAKGNKYRWPGIRIAKGDLTSKLALRYPKLQSLGRIENIAVVSKTSWGRPVMLRLKGRSGESAEMRAEDLRLAVGSTALRSTYCRIASEPESIAFSDGRGFGHGMGMCQWGMQAMALQGFNASQIVRHYYPGAHLTRVY